MLFTTHAIVGAALGAATQNPALGFFSGFLSHHILDSIPHFDQGSFRTIRSGAPYLGRERISEGADNVWTRRDWNVLFADWLLAAIVFGFIFYYTPFSFWLFIATGALGGLMPDIVDSSPLWSKKLRVRMKSVSTYHRFHTFFHWTVAYKEIFWGIITQLLVIFISLFCFFYFLV